MGSHIVDHPFPSARAGMTPGSSMAALREWAARLWGTVRTNRADRDLEEELRLHLELADEDARRHDDASGAVRTARIRAGGVAQAMAALRDQRGLPWIQE